MCSVQGFLNEEDIEILFLPDQTGQNIGRVELNNSDGDHVFSFPSHWTADDVKLALKFANFTYIRGCEDTVMAQTLKE